MQRERPRLRKRARNVRRWWAAFYTHHFPRQFEKAGGEKHLKKLRVPEARWGFSEVLFVLEGLTLEDVFEAWVETFTTEPSKCISDLDKEIKSSRGTKRSYVIRVRDRPASDEELSGMSARLLKSEGGEYMTLLERMLLELVFFDASGTHLDSFTRTLCASSWCVDGHVPTVSCLFGAPVILAVSPDCASQDVRAREIVFS